MTESDLEVTCKDCGAKVLIDPRDYDLTPICPECYGVMSAEAGS
jgi:Zn finger protein HypA/HybF involved in hydrogenase expression